MEPSRLFQFCPRCGQRRPAHQPPQPFLCDACGLRYFFNPVIAVAAILLGPDDRALFIRRAKDPAKGKLAVPGGFVDIGETAEEGMRREIKEEVNLEAGKLSFLCTALNQYLYEGVTYPVLDICFVTRAISIEPIAALDGVESFCWLKPSEVDPNEIAFPSIHAALRAYAAVS